MNLTDFTLPRYNEIPNVGLYLKQVVKLIDEAVAPLGLNVSDTMLSNYVKKHIISSPVKKMYDREQIASLLFVVMTKTVLSLDNIEILLKMQKKSYAPETAYDYFCGEFENVLQYVCGNKDKMDEIGEVSGEEKRLLKNIVITMAHKFYLDECFDKMKVSEE